MIQIKYSCTAMTTDQVHDCSPCSLCASARSNCWMVTHCVYTAERLVSLKREHRYSSVGSWRAIQWIIGSRDHSWNVDSTLQFPPHSHFYIFIWLILSRLPTSPLVANHPINNSPLNYISMHSWSKSIIMSAPELLCSMKSIAIRNWQSSSWSSPSYVLSM